MLIAQCIGSLVVCTATFVSAMAMFGLLNKFSLLRVSHEGEMIGLDVDQHGITAYPEYVISSTAMSHDHLPIGAKVGLKAKTVEST